MKMIISLILLSLLLGCSCFIPKGETMDSYLIKHEITYTNKGTRSEARHGHLYINNKEIPDVFIRVVDKTISYKFFRRVNMWGNDGYFPDHTDKNTGFSDTGENAGDKILNRGYSEGRNRYADIPERWIYVEYKGGEAFVDPLRFFEMISELNPETILRTTEMQRPMRLQPM